MKTDPVGVKDIARRLGVKPQTVSMWRMKNLLPPHRWTVSDHPVWEWADIETWAKATNRPRNLYNRGGANKA